MCRSSDKCVYLSRIRVLKHSAGDDRNKTKTIMQKFQVLRYIFSPWLERRQKIYREPLGAELEKCPGRQRIEGRPLTVSTPSQLFASGVDEEAKFPFSVKTEKRGYF